MEIKKMYIDGEWVEGSEGKTFKSINPSNGEVIAEIAEASVEDARRAIAAAKKSSVSYAGEEAVNALVSLGFSRSEAGVAVGKLDGDLSTEEMIKKALNVLSKNI